MFINTVRVAMNFGIFIVKRMNCLKICYKVTY